ncbi:multidrug ABC transporter ATP-binding protein [Pullulanibacillus camelliae]|uniref:Multidrug ABC transporter ATP-binding protein n=1 Tax=Pullulanibacillus camelliae TaxID=1707096 RepID=A0A8J2VNQ5_9BACL|nr:ABC transporter ATP-binding protein [Pullulanibacillus camelliae]GGE40508.1 multidrug ABC transporter ATP-binding protein [Pullulanibacillus camelliae]
MLALFKFFKPYKWFILAILIFTLLQALSNLYLPTLMSDIVDKGIVNNDISYIIKIGIYMLIISVIAAVFSIITSFLSAKTAIGFGRDVRNEMFSRVESFSLQEFDTIGTASIITRTTNDILQVQQVYMMIFRVMITAPMMCIGGIVMALSKDKMLSLVVIVAMPILFVIIWSIGKRGMPLFRAIQKRLDRMNLVLRERLTGIRVVRAFNRSDHEEKRFEKANHDLAASAIKVNKIMAMMMPSMMLILNLATIAIVWFGSIRIDHGHMQVGDLMAFIQYAMQIMFSLIMLSMMFVMVPRASASATRIQEVLTTEPSIIEDGAVEAEQPISRKEGITFQKVTFNYPGAEKPALADITFTARPGEVTAIIGGTGSGKSTLLKLIERFYDYQEGQITIGGREITQWPLKQLRSQIGYVPQKVALFSGTVNENIKFGKREVSDEEIRHVAQVAQASEFIARMKEGYETYLTQNASNLSGGQKQRLSIARALIRKPAIYLFDDSFSALDYKTDAALRSALVEETKEATMLIVAQRVSTVMHADQIIVLEDGHMVGIGTHEQLLNECSVYKEIVASQIKGEGIA